MRKPKKTPIDPVKLRECLEKKMLDKDIAKVFGMTPDGYFHRKLWDKEILKVYHDFSPEPIYARSFKNTQDMYDMIQEWIDKRGKEKHHLNIPSLEAHLHIGDETFYKLLNRDTQKEWITTDNGEIYVSAHDLIVEAKKLIEASLNDAAVDSRSIGAIFILKNHYGYRDERQVQVGKDEPINITWQSRQQIEGGKVKTIEA